jgi:hypothetical protein
MPAARSLLFLSVPLAAVAFASPAQAACWNGVANVPCDYLPHSIADYAGGLNDERAAVAADPPDAILHRVTLDPAANATCNDGSTAVMYVREALTEADDDKWIIVLEGGGAAFDATGNLRDGFWKRWTNPGNASQLDWIQKTSTDMYDAAGARGQDGVIDQPLEVVVGGVLHPTSSAFADWNWVYLNYCSSDQWAGTVTALELTGSSFLPGMATNGLLVDFNGHNIVADALDQLRNGGGGTDEDVEYGLPDLDGAELVLLAGESAGGHGVQHNLDYVEGLLAPNGTQVLGSIGAALKPEIVAGSNWEVDNLAPIGTDDIQQGYETTWIQMQQALGYVDQSCAATLADWRCMSLFETDAEIATPHLIKQDLRDPIVGSPYATLADYQDGVDSALSLLSGPTVGVFGPKCQHHESLTGAEHYLHELDLIDVATGMTLDTVHYNDALADFVDSQTIGAAVPKLWHGMTVVGPAYWEADCN